jgi:large subunit ribosomal protein L4
MNITLYSQAGQKRKDISLNSEIFSDDINESLIALGLKYQLCNARKAIADVKNKSEVRGGGRKPFRQKGTGRARQGGIRNPHYKGGGVAFGPTNMRNFSIQMPQKQRKKAILNALCKKIKDNKVFALEEIESKIVKTKEFSKIMQSLPIERTVLFVTERKDESMKTVSRNLPNTKVIMADYLNIFDLLKFDKICLLEKTIPKLNKIFLKSDKNN